MIKCNLSILMGRDKLKVMDVARMTNLNRSSITSLYKETASRVDLETIDRLCRLFQCEVGDLLVFVDEESTQDVDK